MGVALQGVLAWFLGMLLYSPPPMFDLKYVREHLDTVRSRLNSRGGGDGDKLAEALELDEKRRKAITDAEALKSQAKKASKE